MVECTDKTVIWKDDNQVGQNKKKSKKKDVQRKRNNHLIIIRTSVPSVCLHPIPFTFNFKNFKGII